MIEKHTCDELGICHLPCSGPPGPNRYPFAPGVIEGPAQPGADDWLAEVIAIAIVLGAIAAIAGFATGYLSLPGWML